MSARSDLTVEDGSRRRSRIGRRTRPIGSPMITLGTLGVAAFVFATMQSMVIPVLPAIQQEFHTSQNGLTWMLTGYLLSASVATPIVGRMGDMFGKKRMLVLTLLVFAAGTVLAAAAGSFGLLVTARVIQGVGGALFPLSFGIVRDEFPSDRVAGAIGLLSAMLAVGGGAGIVLAGSIQGHLGLRGLFWLPLPLVAVAIVVAVKLIPESPVKSGGSVNWLAAAAFAGWLVALLLGVTWGPSHGWLSPAVLGLFAAAAVVFALWWLVELRTDHPLIDTRMLRQPVVWRTNLVALCVGWIMYASLALVPDMLQAPSSTGYGFGASVTESGLYLLPQTVVVGTLGILAGRIAARFGSARAVLVGAALGALSSAALAVFHTQSWQVVLACVVLGGSVGLTFAGLPNVIVQSVSPDQTSVATGMNANLRTVGGAVGGQITASILSNSSATSRFPAEGRFVVSFVVLAGVALVATLVAAMLPRRSAFEAVPVSSEAGA